MRHQAHHVATLVADAGDVVEAAVGIVDVADHDAVAGTQLLERRRIAHVVAFEVVDGNAQVLPECTLVGEHGRRRLHAQLDRLAQELQARVLLQRAGQQPGLGEHLETVADADHRTARGREFADRGHHRREAGQRAGAEVVAVREAAGNDDRVDAVDGRVGVPAQLRFRAQALDRPHHVELAVGARELHHPDVRAHDDCSNAAIDTSYDSITGFASSRSHISSTWRRAASASGASTTSRITLPMCTCVDVGVSERGQRPLDGRSRGIGDARPVRDLDVSGERSHGAERTE